MNNEIYAELEKLKAINEEFQYENVKLKLKNEEFSRLLADYEHRINILIRQTNEWAKSYDNLLKDFISYRNGTR